jgi:hypothetical protein
VAVLFPLTICQIPGYLGVKSLEVNSERPNKIHRAAVWRTGTAMCYIVIRFVWIHLYKPIIPECFQFSDSCGRSERQKRR